MQKAEEVRTMSVPDFALDAVAVVDGIARTGREIVLTNEGRAVARLVPVESAAPRVNPMDDDWSNDE